MQYRVRITVQVLVMQINLNVSELLVAAIWHEMSKITSLKAGHIFLPCLLKPKLKLY